MKVGVCGAGLMGTGIAQVFASSGHVVVLYDMDATAIERALGHIARDLQVGVARGKVAPEQIGVITGRISGAEDLSKLAGSDLVIEAVAEQLETKKDVFAALDEICLPPALLVSNTSTLSLTEIAAGLRYPDRFSGLHFFNPAQRMQLVEILPARQTSPATIGRLREIAGDIGKTAVVAKESPGGIVSRLQLLVRNEAIRMVSEGVATKEDIDTAMKLGSGWPMGPIELSDLVGLDVHTNNSDLLADALGDDRFRPDPLVRNLVQEGHYGRKTGRGFYVYEQEGGVHDR